MIITDSKLYRYRIPLIRRLHLKGETYTEREGLILVLSDSEGNWGAGEIAPLPGFSRENIDRAQQQTETVLRSLNEDQWKPLQLVDNIDACIAYAALPQVSGCMPSVDFGLRSALCTLLACQMKAPPGVGNTGRYVTISALLAGNDSAALNRAVTLCNQGYNTFKLKVGNHKIDHDLNLVHQLREKLGERCDLRLDANRAWGIDEAVSFLEQVAPCGIEYIEEPVHSLDPLRQLLRSDDLAVPIALDETLTDFESQSALERSLPEWRRAGAFVIKPTMLGGAWEGQLTALALAENIPIVYSSSFESPIGIAVLAQMAAAGNQANVTAGLGTLDWFPPECRLPGVECGRIDVRSNPGIQILDPDWLSEVKLCG